MVDVVNPATRSRMMSGIGTRDTKPELMVRKSLHAQGLRYVLGGAKLPGRPDIVFPSRKVAIFVHGCFWHWHGCQLSKIPSSNTEFWQIKLAGNKSRDLVAELSLISAGWRVAVVWECATRGPMSAKFESQMQTLSRWIAKKSIEPYLDISLEGAQQA